VKIFLDTNVLLDVLGRRAPHSAHAAVLWSRVEAGVYEGHVSAISFNNIYYILRRTTGRKAARDAMKLLRDTFHIAPVDEQTVHRAIDSDLPDFEDAIQFACALRAGADCILTRDVKGFPGSTVPATTPEEFLAHDSD